MTDEQKQTEYVSLTDLAKEMGIKRTSLYYYLTELKIPRYTFKFNRNSFVTREDAERIKATKSTPWVVQPPEEPKQDAA